jgi:hypothetical protein
VEPPEIARGGDPAPPTPLGAIAPAVMIMPCLAMPTVTVRPAAMLVPNPIALPRGMPERRAAPMPAFVPAPIAVAAQGRGRAGRRDRQHQRGADQELRCCRPHRETRSRTISCILRRVYAAHPESKKTSKDRRGSGARPGSAL